MFSKKSLLEAYDYAGGYYSGFMGYNPYSRGYEAIYQDDEATINLIEDTAFPKMPQRKMNPIISFFFLSLLSVGCIFISMLAIFSPHYAHLQMQPLIISLMPKSYILRIGLLEYTAEFSNTQFSLNPLKLLKLDGHTKKMAENIMGTHSLSHLVLTVCSLEHALLQLWEMGCGALTTYLLLTRITVACLIIGILCHVCVVVGVFFFWFQSRTLRCRTCILSAIMAAPIVVVLGIVPLIFALMTGLLDSPRENLTPLNFFYYISPASTVVIGTGAVIFASAVVLLVITCCVSYVLFNKDFCYESDAALFGDVVGTAYF